MEVFTITDDFIQLNKLLKATGLVDSGGQASQLIQDGHVLVNGSVELRKRCKIRNSHIVQLGDKSITVVKGEMVKNDTN